ncbi:hypothetical protein M2421_002302 [Stenotrophomonas sp. BIGb0135]|nr:hypothetical protein [Stenotrophomonas sp. BIGb0135]MCS4235122.1 hypothetical protein [Stenotrophomonas sp. BIGb0135]
MRAKNLSRHIRSRHAWGRWERFSLTSVSAAHGCIFIATRHGSAYYQRIED